MCKNPENKNTSCGGGTHPHKWYQYQSQCHQLVGLDLSLPVAQTTKQKKQNPEKAAIIEVMGLQLWGLFFRDATINVIKLPRDARCSSATFSGRTTANCRAADRTLRFAFRWQPSSLNSQPVKNSFHQHLWNDKVFKMLRSWQVAVRFRLRFFFPLNPIRLTLFVMEKRLHCHGSWSLNNLNNL